MTEDLSGGPDIKDVESSLQRLWERARRISDVVTTLRKEKEELRAQLATEREAHEKLAATLEEKERELVSLRGEVRKLQQNGSSFLNKEEKEALSSRIKELITKIDSRL